MKRHWLGWGMAAVLCASAGAGRAAAIEEQDAQQLLRLARIEQALPASAQLGELLCVDDAMGQRPLPPSGAHSAQRLEDKARRAFEQCRLIADARADDSRLVTQLRATLVARVAQLGPMRMALEQCRGPRLRPAAAQECIARVLGRPATTEEVAAFTQEAR